jgi:membrane protein required for colicin V production
MANFPVLDWIFLAVLLLSFLMGIWRGFVFELFSLATWFGAFIAAQVWGQETGMMLPMAGASEPVRLGAGFICVFVSAIFAGGLLAVMVKKLVAVVGLSAFDRVLGAGFGLIRGVLILMVSGVLIALTPVKNSGFWRESVGASLIAQVFKGLQPILPQEYGKYLS